MKTIKPFIGLVILFCITGISHAIEGWVSLRNFSEEIVGISMISPTLGFSVSTGDIHKTTDGGYTWTNVEHSHVTWYRAIQFSDANNGFATGGDLTMVTHDGGVTWNAHSNYGVWNSIAVIGANAAYTAGYELHGTRNGGGMITHTTDGETWTNQDIPTTNRLNGICFPKIPHPMVGFAVGDSGTIINTTNSGLNWTLQTSGTFRRLKAVSFSDENHGFVVGDSGTILHTSNAGGTWKAQYSGETDYLRTVSALDSNTALIGGGDFTLKTTDGGAHWKKITISDGYVNTFYCIQVINANDAIGAGISYETGSGGVGPGSVFKYFPILPPSTPTLMTPNQDAKGNGPSATFTWNAASEASSYQLQVSSDSTFSSLFANDSTTELSRTLNGLAYNSLYYWRVQARNAGGLSRWASPRSFTTVPEALNLLLPAQNAVNLPTSPNLSWFSTVGAITYRLQVSKDAKFSTPLYFDSTIAGQAQDIGPLNNNSAYYWRVSAQNNGGNSAWSQVRTFSTIPGAPSKPMLTAPFDKEQNVTIKVPFSWTPSSGATSYRIRISGDASLTVSIKDTVVTEANIVLGPFANSYTYYWNVVASNSYGPSPLSSTFQFTTTAPLPSAPILVSPANSVANISLSPVLSWSSTSGAVTYRVQVSTDPAFASVFVDDSTLTAPGISIQSLATSTLYYWRVNGKNASGTGTWSTIRFFTTTSILPPATPTPISPAQNTRNWQASTMLSWKTFANTLYSHIQLSTDSLFSKIVLDDSTNQNLSLSAGPLAYNTNYYWRVSAKNPSGQSPWSPIFKFSTLASTASPSVKLLLPSTDAIIHQNSVLLSWSSPLTLSPTQSIYRVQWSKDSLFKTLTDSVDVRDSIAGADTFHVAENLINGTYYWRVKLGQEFVNFLYGYKIITFDSNSSATHKFLIQLPTISISHATLNPNIRLEKSGTLKISVRSQKRISVRLYRGDGKFHCIAYDATVKTGTLNLDLAPMVKPGILYFVVIRFGTSRYIIRYFS